MHTAFASARDMAGRESPSQQQMAPRTTNLIGCPLCRHRHTDELFRSADRAHRTVGVFTYRRCLVCRSVFQDPQVIDEDLHLCYPRNYYTHLPPENAGPQQVAARPSRFVSRLRDAVRYSMQMAVTNQRMPFVWGCVGKSLALFRSCRERAFYDLVLDELLPNSATANRAIDVGCGSGQLMLELQQVGWKVEGLEIDTAAAQVARRVTGRSIWEGTLSNSNLPRSSYDLIVLRHVFEHLAEPARVLRRIAELLTPTGKCVLIYPNPGSLGARLYKQHWFPWEIPRHLILPTASALAGLAATCGVVLQRQRTIVSVNVPHWLAHSRSYRQHDRGEPSEVRVTRIDWWITRLEQLLIQFGLPVGEEIVAVLKLNTTQRC